MVKKRKVQTNPHRTGDQPSDDVSIRCRLREHVYEINSMSRIWVFTEYFTMRDRSYTSTLHRLMIRHVSQNPYCMTFSNISVHTVNWVDDYCFQLFFGIQEVFSISHDYISGDYTLRGDHRALMFIDKMFRDTYLNDTDDLRNIFPFDQPDTIRLINLRKFLKIKR